MSKIYTKTTRNPFIVEKVFAEKLHTDFINKSKQPEEMITVKHSLGMTSFLFGEIRAIDVTSNDNDFKASISEHSEKTYAPPPVFELDDNPEYFRERSRILKDMMGWK